MRIGFPLIFPNGWADQGKDILRSSPRRLITSRNSLSVSGGTGSSHPTTLPDCSSATYPFEIQTQFPQVQKIHCSKNPTPGSTATLLEIVEAVCCVKLRFVFYEMPNRFFVSRPQPLKTLLIYVLSFRLFHFSPFLITYMPASSVHIHPPHPLQHPHSSAYNCRSSHHLQFQALQTDMLCDIKLRCYPVVSCLDCVLRFFLSFYSPYSYLIVPYF